MQDKSRGQQQLCEMPKFTLRTINSSFFTESELDRANADEALAEGVRAALMIAADEISVGTAASAVEVIVNDGSFQQVSRSAVSVSVAPLAVDEVEKRAFPTPTNDH